VYLEDYEGSKPSFKSVRPSHLFLGWWHWNTCSGRRWRLNLRRCLYNHNLLRSSGKSDWILCRVPSYLQLSRLLAKCAALAAPVDATVIARSFRQVVGLSECGSCGGGPTANGRRKDNTQSQKYSSLSGAVLSSNRFLVLAVEHARCPQTQAACLTIFSSQSN